MGSFLRSSRSLGMAACFAFAAPAGAQTAKTLSLGVAVSGVIGKITIADGSHVDSGQVILEIDCRPLAAEAKMREAYAAAGQAAYERARNGSRPDDIAVGEANVGVAQARAEEAQDALTRAKGLTEGVSVTRAQILEIRKDARVTAAQLEDTRKRLALLVAGSRPEDIAEALARRDAVAAEAEEAKARLDQCSLKAPAAGVVQLTATLGQFVSVYAPATLAKLTPDKPTQ
jgi:multidrug resistance efflux pump